ncbi:unnamed protein product [Trichobilharzia regenti]|nr:unnamed protein product [Trichobilharzia regenti]
MASSSGLETDYITLTRFILQEQRKCPNATGELTQLMNGLQTAIKAVSNAVRKAGMINLHHNPLLIMYVYFVLLKFSIELKNFDIHRANKSIGVFLLNISISETE